MTGKRNEVSVLSETNRGMAEPSNSGGEMRRISLVLLSLILGHLPLVAQSDHAMLSGTVTDSKNGRIAAARVAVKSVATSLEYDAVSNSAGVYVLNALPIGEYTATVTAQGFEKLEFEPFALQVGESRMLNVSLAVAMVSTVVQVAAEDDLKRTSVDLDAVKDGKTYCVKKDDGSFFNAKLPLKDASGNVIAILVMEIPFTSAPTEEKAIQTAEEIRQELAKEIPDYQSLFQD
jgi:hypothetical protein